MPKDPEPIEAAPANGEPFAEVEEVSPGLKYILERWKLTEDSPPNTALVIEGHVSTISVKWTLKRGHYASDSIDGMIVLQPDNLKCDLLVYHPQAEIIAARGDLGVVGEVFRQFGRMAGIKLQEVAKAHMQEVYPDIPEPQPTDSRVDAGKGGHFTTSTQSF
jgi:hypothetical protein